MNKTLRNFWIDIILFLLLGANIALVSLTQRTPTGVHPGPGWHIHAILSMLLAFGCMVHTLLHWRWFVAVLTGKAKGKIKLVMNSLVVVAMILANLSGHALLASGTASRLHSFTGAFALIGLSVHAIKHARWMVMIAKRHIVGGDQKEVILPA